MKKLLILLLLASCSQNQEFKAKKSGAEELLRFSKLPENEKIRELESQGWKEPIDIPLGHLFKKADSTQFLIGESNGAEYNLVITKNEELYIQYKKEFEKLGYVFEMNYVGEMIQFNSTRLEGSHVVSAILQPSAFYYQIGVYRKRIKLETEDRKIKDQNFKKLIESLDQEVGVSKEEPRIYEDTAYLREERVHFESENEE